MRVLLLHPEDLPDGGAWNRERWDLVVDLGFAGPETYADWSRTLKSRVLSIHQFAGQTEGYRWVNRIFERGRGRLLDRLGLDWWEILAMESYQDLHTLYLLRQLQREVCVGRVQLVASRPHRVTRIAEQAFGGALRYFEHADEGVAHRTMRALRSARKLQFAQVAEIAFDKWDSGYQLRRHFTRRGYTKAGEPCVLLPSAYSNVTRSVLAYASLLPDRKFLLIATRRNAVPVKIPSNVTVGSLAAYVGRENKTREEGRALQDVWHALAIRLQSEDDEFRCAANAGVWDYLPAHLEHGLQLREAWSSVLKSETVTGVLCGDDLNYHTRLPLLLAQKQGLNAVYCSHGALDSGFFFKKALADSFLVKGDMEREYLEHAAAIEQEKIFVGAPAYRRYISADSRTGEGIVFFSQPYEVSGGRAESIYRELVPRLHAVAHASGRKLIIKLHPFESKRERQALVNSALASVGSKEVEIVDGAPPEQVMSRAWCGVTVDSSVAVECAVNDIPFFLCGWLDFTGDGYLKQFARFGIAQVLNSADDIERIPQMISDFRPDPAKLQRIWHEADASQLDEIVFATRRARLNPCVC